METQIIKKGYSCDICGHPWASILDRAPKVCPKCKRYDWNKEGIKKVDNPKEVLQNAA